VGRSGAVDPVQVGQGQRHVQARDRHRHVRRVHAGRRGRRPATTAPRPARQHTRAAVLLEAVLRRGRGGRHRVHRSQQPVQEDRRQRVLMSEHMSGRIPWTRLPGQRSRERRPRTGRQQWAHLLLYQRVVRKGLRRAGPNRVSIANVIGKPETPTTTSHILYIIVTYLYLNIIR